MLTTDEAATTLGIARGTIHMQIRLGKLRAEKRGRDLFITLEEVERYRRENLRAKDGAA